LHLAALPGVYAAQRKPDELDSAQRLLANGDYSGAYAEFLKHARSNALAQFSVGLFHQFGWGRTPNPAVACDWFGRAAKGNIPAAQHYFAECLRYGIHAPADLPAAALMYREAAKNGHFGSLCPLAELYIHGDGVPKTPTEGLALCRQAAERGVTVAQVRLGRFYLEESSVRDDAAARHWFEVAARSNFAEGQYFLARMLEAGATQSSDNLAARNWYEAAAGQGFLPAYLPVAQLYAKPPSDPSSAQLGATAQLGAPAQLGEVELAKAYLWAAAATKRLQGAEQSEAQHLLTQLLGQVPPSWLPDLDAKVAAHLQRIAPFAVSTAP